MGRQQVAVLILVLLLPLLTGAASFTGKVVGVIDGDSIEIEIRLHGIDCPERGQAFGKEAKQAALALVHGKEVTIQAYDTDDYGRTIADVFLPDGLSVNQQLVREGWCWWYREYAPGDTLLEQLEKEAREARKGLWQDAAPIPPWEYRKRGEQPPLADGAAGPIIGNRRSRIYHRPDCPDYAKVAPKNRIVFESTADAEAAGFRQARNCP